MYYAAKCALISFVIIISLFPRVAKKEDDPEQALKEFKTIIEKEEEKGDWCVPFADVTLRWLTVLEKGVQGTQTVDKTTFPGPQTTKRGS